MKKALIVILSIALMMTFTITSLGSTIAVKSIKLNTESIKLQVGKSQTLKVEITPVNASNKKLTFSSNNKKIATVDKKGKIKAIKVGKAVITVASSSNKKAKATCNVTVEPRLKAVELKMYLLGDPAKEYDLMLGELNKLLKKDLKATLKVNFIGWSDWEKKYSLVLASGEQFDLIYTSNWAKYAGMASKGAFLELDKLLPEFAPKTYAEMPKVAWEQAKINGKIYLLPMNFDETNPNSWVVRGDLRKKYNIPEIKTNDDFEAYLDAVAKNEEGMIPFNVGPFEIDLMTTMILYENDWDHKDVLGAHLCYDMKDPAAKVLNMIETPQYKDFVKKMRSWYQKGYWSKSVLQNKVDGRDSLQSGKSAATLLNIGTFNAYYSTVMDRNPSWDLEWFPMGPDTASYVNPYINNGMAVPASAQNPERAAMFLEKVHQDEAYYDLLWYGIKGKHYELTSDGRLTLPAGVSAETVGYPAGGPCPWGFMDRKFNKESAKGWPKYEEAKAKVVARAVVPTLLSFSFIEDSVKSEYAAISGLDDKYFKSLNMGLLDPDKYLPEYIKKEKQAGIDKIIKENQRQIDEYLKNAGR